MEDYQLNPLEMLVSEYIHELKYGRDDPPPDGFIERAKSIIEQQSEINWETPSRFSQNLFADELTQWMSLDSMLSLLGEGAVTALHAHHAKCQAQVINSQTLPSQTVSSKPRL